MHIYFPSAGTARKTKTNKKKHCFFLKLFLTVSLLKVM